MRYPALGPLIIAVILAGGLPHPTLAQNLAIDPSLRAATEGVGLGTQVRVTTYDNVLMLGSFLRLEENGLLLEERGLQVTRVPTANLLEFSHRRRAWRKGLLFGAGTGVLVGALGGWYMVLACEHCADRDVSNAVVFGSISFGLIGSTLGALLGSAFGEWHVSYP